MTSKQSKFLTWTVFLVLSSAQVLVALLAATGYWHAAGGLLMLVLLFQLVGVLRLLGRERLRASAVTMTMTAGPQCSHELQESGAGYVQMNTLPQAVTDRMVAHGGLGAWRAAFEAYARSGVEPMVAVEAADTAALEYEKRLRRFHALPD